MESPPRNLLVYLEGCIIRDEKKGVWLLAALLRQALLLIWENHNALHMSGRAHSVETATARHG
jgi:hypothetical protein